MMARFLTALLAGTALLGAADAANALTMTQSATVGGGTASVTTDLSAVSYSNQFNLFNAAAIALANPGKSVTLNDVVLSFSSVGNTTGTLKNTSGSTATFEYQLSLKTYLDTQGTLTDAQQIFQNNFGNGVNASQKILFDDSTYTNLANNGTVNYPKSGVNTVSTNVSPVTLTDSTSLAAFSGTTAFGLQFSTVSGQSITGGGGNLQASLTTKAGSTVTLAYDYTLTDIPTGVPEPASMALLGAGILGAGLLRRRAK